MYSHRSKIIAHNHNCTKTKRFVIAAHSLEVNHFTSNRWNRNINWQQTNLVREIDSFNRKWQAFPIKIQPLNHTRNIDYRNNCVYSIDENQPEKNNKSVIFCWISQNTLYELSDICGKIRDTIYNLQFRVLPIDVNKIRQTENLGIIFIAIIKRSECSIYCFFVVQKFKTILYWCRFVRWSRRNIFE